MVDSSALQEVSERQILFRFVTDNTELEALETLVEQFNLFEALGVTRRELTHSNVLAFLLDPHQNHGLGDKVLRRLLQRVLISATSLETSLTPIDFDVWSFDNVAIRREWQNIDLLCVDDEHRFVVVIENKIGSSEHSNQLERYREIVETQFPNHRRLLLYLSPDGSAPTDETYFAVDYKLIADTIETIGSTGFMPTSGIEVLMEHYVRMLRRHVVADSEIAELCRRIYLKHQRALDLIYEHRPDRQADLKMYLQRLIAATPGLIPDLVQKEYIRFGLPEWDVPDMLRGKGWTNSGRMLLFQFNNFPEGLALVLEVGPGDEADRARLVKRAEGHRPPFGSEFTIARWRSKIWTNLWVRPFLTRVELEEMSLSQVTDRVSQEWSRFLESELTLLRDLMLTEPATGRVSEAQNEGRSETT
jgi:hypothetical protein